MWRMLLSLFYRGEATASWLKAWALVSGPYIEAYLFHGATGPGLPDVSVYLQVSRSAWDPQKPRGWYWEGEVHMEGAVKPAKIRLERRVLGCLWDLGHLAACFVSFTFPIAWGPSVLSLTMSFAQMDDP